LIVKPLLILYMKTNRFKINTRNYKCDLTMKNLKFVTLTLALMCSTILLAQTININPKVKGSVVGSDLYGVFFEEINHAGDGGLYAELVKNRNFEEHIIPSGMKFKDGFAIAPHSLNYEHGGYSDWKIKWDMDSLKMDGWKVRGDAGYEISSENQLNPNTPNAMRLEMRSTGVVLENSGYWGMRIIGKDKYDLRFYVNPQNFSGSITARIVSMNGVVLAEQSFNIAKSDKWEEHTAVMSANATDYKAKLELVFSNSGKVYVDYVSLFPQNTFKGRKNGMRPDVAQMIANLNPGFFRWPGGCIAEGATLENRAKWKETLGDPMQRHSEWILWNYHSTWGFGYHEFLQFCEDIGAAGMFVANVGMSCSVRNGDWTEDYEPYLQDIIDAIDYATAPTSNKWGAKRAAAGHPEPFNLKNVELGNEQVGDHYAQRYNYFYRILKAKYPQITFISTLQLSPSREKLEKADMIDPHWYVNAGFFYDNDRLFDKMERGKYDIYIGEYAVISEANMNSALAEAAFLTGVERNSDLVKMASYAPLLQNNNRKDWPTNLIWYDNQKAMGRASYYVQQMYANNCPSYNIESSNAEPERNLSMGKIGFVGSDVQSMVRNFSVKDANGKVMVEKKPVESLRKIERQSSNRWIGKQIINLLDGVSVNGGIVEFEVRLLESEVEAPRFDTNRKPRKVTAAPVFLFGSDENANDYFILNLPQVIGDRTVMTMSRATNGEANIDRNPGGSNLKMELNKWYKIRIEFAKNNQVNVYMDGDKVFEQIATIPSGHYTLTGYDEKTGEIIIKVVNSTDKEYTPTININAASVQSNGAVITLSTLSKKDENTMNEPTKIVPVITEFNKFRKKFNYTFKANSFSILRIKSKL
jgi:alpha-L-arabinofuranosidase